MIDNVLGGHGRVAATPIPEVYGDSYNPNATFAYDPAEAERILTRSGLDRRCRRNPFERRSAGAVHDHVQLRRHPFDVISLRHLPPMLSLSASRWISKRSPGTA